MLEVGRECDLTLLCEAYDNYMNHYYCFFLISDLTAQRQDFFNELYALKLIKPVPDSETEFELLDISIADALRLL
jgi:hypothetical protein